MSICSVGLQALNYGKRILNVTPELILGTGSEAMGEAMRATKGSIFSKAEAGWRTLEASAKPGFFKRLFDNIIGMPKSLWTSATDGAAAATTKGGSKLLGGLKGFGSGIVKKMPLIGALATIGFELPNIFKAGKEEGVLSAGKEAVKATARLGGGAVGAAIGSAICPGLGSVIGWCVGEWLTGKIVGPTYTEKKEEEAEQAQAQAQTDGQGQEQAQPVQYTQEEINYLKSLGATDEQIQQLQAKGVKMSDLMGQIGYEQGQVPSTATQYPAQQTVPQEGQLTMPPSYPSQQDHVNPFQSNPYQITPYQNYTDMMGYNTGMMNPYMQGPYGGYNSGLASSPYADDIYFQQMFGYNNPYMTNQTMMNPYVDPTYYGMQPQNLGFVA